MRRIKQIVRQVIRGCTRLPHVGHHPGNASLVMFALMGAGAGTTGGWRSILGGVAVMLAWSVPVYLYGAYTRVNDSEQFGREADKQIINQETS